MKLFNTKFQFQITKFLQFSTIKNHHIKIYDLITIGPYANRIAQQITTLISHPI